MPERGLDLLLRGIKLVDICIITTLYFVLACIVSIFVDSRIMGQYDADRESRKSTARLVLDLVVYASCFSVLLYTVRNLAELIPSPLNGLFGFQHNRVSELKSAGIFTIVYFWMQYNLQARMKYLYHRVAVVRMHRSRSETVVVA